MICFFIQSFPSPTREEQQHGNFSWGKKPFLVILWRANIVLNFFVWHFNTTASHELKMSMEYFNLNIESRYNFLQFLFLCMKAKLYNPCTTWYLTSEISEISMALTLWFSTKLTTLSFFLMDAFNLLFSWIGKNFSLIKNKQFAKIATAVLLKEGWFVFFFWLRKLLVPLST